ncbi:hypothetical protein GCM10020366_08840 [Saccharopolyspora gregorii]|uniref:Uncharacterized protein n=1 Tax=Saccharopolyspora gregorii TaxID=33914 RepID=A0ABP6RKH1_9PSEU
MPLSLTLVLCGVLTVLGIVLARRLPGTAEPGSSARPARSGRAGDAGGPSGASRRYDRVARPRAGHRGPRGGAAGHPVAERIRSTATGADAAPAVVARARTVSTAAAL